MGWDAIAITWRHYRVDTESSAGRVGLGHAGVLLINTSTGRTEYYEYGRYDRAHHGFVRQVRVPNVELTAGPGGTAVPTDASLHRVLEAIDQSSGQNGPLAGAYVRNMDGDAARAWIRQGGANGERGTSPSGAAWTGFRQPEGAAYALTYRNCGTFVHDALKHGGVSVPWMFDPRPSSYIDELRGQFGDVDLTVRGGRTELRWTPEPDPGWASFWHHFYAPNTSPQKPSVDSGMQEEWLIDPSAAPGSQMQGDDLIDPSQDLGLSAFPDLLVVDPSRRLSELLGREGGSPPILNIFPQAPAEGQRAGGRPTVGDGDEGGGPEGADDAPDTVMAGEGLSGFGEEAEAGSDEDSVDIGDQGEAGEGAEASEQDAGVQQGEVEQSAGDAAAAAAPAVLASVSPDMVSAGPPAANAGAFSVVDPSIASSQPDPGGSVTDPSTPPGSEPTEAASQASGTPDAAYAAGATASPPPEPAAALSGPSPDQSTPAPADPPVEYVQQPPPQPIRH